jgi:pimeloyl-ACP methyl ester carboxylesterase
LALTMLRDHPDGIRSAVLDSSYPLQADLFATAAPHFERSLRLLFDSCAADEACNSAYPDLEGLTFGVAERLNAEPYLTEHIAPLSGELYTVALTGDRFMNFLFQAFYQTGWLPYLPQMIAEADQGQYDLLLTLYLGVVESLGSVSYGMNLSVQCAEEIPFGDPTSIQSASQGSPLQQFMDAQLNTGRYMYDACNLWTPQAAPDPQENQAVTSAVPTLIVAGEFDPITPPDWGAILHEDLPNSYFYTLPATGHGAALGNDCASELLLNFWDSPSSDPAPACLAALPAIQFIAPGQAPDLTLAPWQSATYQVVGVQPAGWEEFSEGIWVRPGLYDTALIQLSLPNVGKEAAFGALLSQLGAEGEPTLLETRPANDYSWEVYQTAFQGQVVYIAAAEAGDLLLLVMLQARESEAADLYGTLLLPAIDALQQE